MGIETQSPRIIEDCLVEALKPLEELDLAALRKSLDALRKGGIPNVVRLKYFKDFLTNLLRLNPEQLVQNLKQLKNSNVLSLEDFKFMQQFVLKENLEGDEEKKKQLCLLLKEVAATTMDKTTCAVLSEINIKGPKVAKCPTKEVDIRDLAPCALYEANLAHEMKEKSEAKPFPIKGHTEKADTLNAATVLAAAPSKAMEQAASLSQKIASKSEVDTGLLNVFKI